MMEMHIYDGIAREGKTSRVNKQAELGSFTFVGGSLRDFAACQYAHQATFD